MPVKVACPHCRHVRFLGDDTAGQAVTCAQCGRYYRAPRAPLQKRREISETPPSSAAQPWVGPVSLQVREVPATFAPTEPLPAQVVPLPDPPPRLAWADDGNEAAPSTESSPARPSAARTSRSSSPVAQPKPAFRWFAGGIFVVLVVAIFIGSATWFVFIRDHRPAAHQRDRRPMIGNGGRPFGGPRFQPMPPAGPQRQTVREAARKGEQVPVAPQQGEVIVTLKLVNGRVEHRGAITPNDANDPIAPGCRRKVFLIELEAKRRYTLELIDPGLVARRRLDEPVDLSRYDPFLRIEDSEGVILDENDDIERGFFLNSRIPNFIPPATGTYRIIASSFDVEQFGQFTLVITDEGRAIPIAPLPLPHRPLPQPVALREPLKPAKEVQNGVTITTMLHNEAPLAADLVWSADGAAFFVLDAAGTLRRINRTEQIVEARLELGVGEGLPPPLLRPLGGAPAKPEAPAKRTLAMCRLGLLVSQPALQEVWLIDPDTLRVVKRISAPGIRRILAVPALAHAFAASRQVVERKPPAAEIDVKRTVKDVVAVLDTAAGVPLHYFDVAPRLAALTPDGQFLFTESSDGKLVRYQVRQDVLVYDDESVPISMVDQGQGICVSPDSRYVCLSCKLGNKTSAFVPEAKIYTTYIFSVDNLRAPVVRIETGSAPRAFGFDPVSRSIFASNQDKQVLRFSMAGVLFQDASAAGAEGPAGQPQQFLTHPHGHAVMVRTERTIYQFEFAKDDDP
ncbi:MAG: hypothetical protein NZO58_01955 [Gemmataceae bacterium]|nr:hypothetical protein [Gemmataceae bacterium]